MYNVIHEGDSINIYNSLGELVCTFPEGAGLAIQIAWEAARHKSEQRGSDYAAGVLAGASATIIAQAQGISIEPPDEEATEKPEEAE